MSTLPGSARADAILTVAIAVLLQGLSGPAAGQEADLTEAPDWVRTRSLPEYPSRQYVLGLGAASLREGSQDAFARAVTQSRADIARQLRTRIQQTVRDSVVERTGPSENSLTEELVRSTRERSRLRLQNAEVARQWTGSGTVYVLSALHRGDAARRARDNIARLERILEEEIDAVERASADDPLEAFRRWREARKTENRLSVQYAVLTGVTRSTHFPPDWTERLDELGQTVRNELGVGILVQARGRAGATGTPAGNSYSELEDVVIDLGWTVRPLPEGVAEQPEELDRPSVRSRLRSSGIRYVLVVEMEPKITDRVQVGETRLHYARAGGRWAVRDLADREIVFESNYSFPSDTKAAHRSASRVRELALSSLLELMKEELLSSLRPEEPSDGGGTGATRSKGRRSPVRPPA